MLNALRTIQRSAAIKWRVVILSFLLCALASLLELAAIAAIPAFLAALVRPEVLLAQLRRFFPVDAASAVPTIEVVLWTGAALAIFLLLKGIALLLITRKQNAITQSYQTAIARLILHKYMHASYEWHAQKNHAELVRNTVNVPISVGYVMTAISNGLTEVLIALLAMAALVLVEPVIAVVVFVALGALALLLYLYFRSRLFLLGQQTNEAARETMKWLNQSIGGLKEIKVAHEENYFVQRSSRHFSDFSWLTLQTQFIVQTPRVFLDFLALLSMLLLALLLAAGGEHADILPTMALFGAAALRLIPSTNRVWNSIAIVKANQDSLNIGLSIIAMPHATEIAQPAEPLSLGSGLSVSSVSYTYEGRQEPALRNVSMAVPAGSIVGIAGPSGSGKSTLLNVMLGLYRLRQGSVKAGEQDIFQTPARWYRTIAYVPQHIFLLDDTIRRNVALGVDDDVIEDSKVWEALQRAHLASFVRELPSGLDTRVGDNGANLSGGQRQRLGIARALYRSPAVLFLDEATSALDRESEEAIVDTLRGLKGQMTVVLISHQARTLAVCDHVYMLDRGAISAVD